MSKWKQLLGKKWAFPAIYMIAAALILAIMWWYQDPNDYPLTKEELGVEEIDPFNSNSQLDDEMIFDELGEAVVVNNPVEQMQWPVLDINNIEVSKEFFDEEAEGNELENAIVSFQNELWPHRGIDIISTDGKEFTVVAVLSGEVIRAEKDPVVGYVVEILHPNGLVTCYSSITDLKVSKGDNITQGTILGVASRNIFEKDEGVHLHFEVKKDDAVLNPNLFFGHDIERVMEQLSNQEN